MSELQSETGYIAKILTSPKNAQWRGYVFQKDDNKAYSVTLNDKVPADLRAELATLQERDYVTFHYKPSTRGDKTYYNIYGLERPDTPQDESGNDSPPPRSNGDLGMFLCNAANVAGGIYGKLVEKAESAEEVTEGVFESLYDLVMMCHNKHRK